MTAESHKPWCYARLVWHVKLQCVTRSGSPYGDEALENQADVCFEGELKLNLADHLWWKVPFAIVVPSFISYSCVGWPIPFFTNWRDGYISCDNVPMHAPDISLWFGDKSGSSLGMRGLDLVWCCGSGCMLQLESKPRYGSKQLSMVSSTSVYGCV